VSCTSPVPVEALVRYWAGDLASAELERIDEHLMSCEVCSAESARLSAVVEALRAFLLPAVSRDKLERLRAQGRRITENTFLPGARQQLVFSSEVDLLIHRLAGLDLTRVENVSLTIRSESTGQVMFEEASVVFDAHEGVLIACQRHYAALPPDTVFELRARDASGAEQTAVYTILHVFDG
jgi:predicted anti-sigma-YlaC factor YlaD